MVRLLSMIKNGMLGHDDQSDAGCGLRGAIVMNGSLDAKPLRHKLLEGHPPGVVIM